MAMIDYGCNFKIDGKIFEHDFDRMGDSDCIGWLPETVKYFDGTDIKVHGNYYCYLGDRDLFLCFYKTYILICSGDKVLDYYDLRFKSEHLIRNGTDIYVKRLSDEYRLEDYCLDFEETDFKNKKEWLRYLKRHHRIGKVNLMSNKFLAEWEYKGHKYSVMYGYGIDTLENMERLYSEGKYDFTEKEIETVRGWFNG